MYRKGDQLTSVVEEAAYYDGLRTSTGWPEVDEVTRGLATGAVWTITCECPVLRRSLAAWFAGRLASLRGRSVLLSMAAPAHESVLHVLAPLVGRPPLAILREQDEESTRAKADRTWSSLDLTVAGPDDDLDQAISPPDRSVHGLVVDRADLLAADRLVEVRDETRRRRRWTVLTAPNQLQIGGPEADDVQLAVERVDGWTARMRLTHASEHTWFDATLSSVGRWQVAAVGS